MCGKAWGNVHASDLAKRYHTHERMEGIVDFRVESVYISTLKDGRPLSKGKRIVLLQPDR